MRKIFSPRRRGPSGESEVLAAHRTVVFVSNSDWDDFWYQRQEFASRFAKRGEEVVFVNKTLTRMPRLRSAFAGTYRKKNRGYVSNPVPERVRVLTPTWLPPFRFLRPFNRLLIRRSLRDYVGAAPLVVCYAPSYNAIDVAEILRADKSVYVNVHNYDAMTVSRDVLRAERRLVETADFVFGDSDFNVRRLEGLAGRTRRDVLQSPPGANIEAFSKARDAGKRAGPRPSLYVFGGISARKHDLTLYAELARDFDVVIVGKVSGEAKEQLPRNVKILPPLPMTQLGQALREADALGIFLKESSYVDGILPAKVFECLATEKPLLVSGVPNLGELKSVVYDVEGSSERAAQVLNNLDKTETDSLRAARAHYAAEAAWESRFNDFVRAIGEEHQSGEPAGE